MNEPRDIIAEYKNLEADIAYTRSDLKGQELDLEKMQREIAGYMTKNNLKYLTYSPRLIFRLVHVGGHPTGSMGGYRNGDEMPYFTVEVVPLELADRKDRASIPKMEAVNENI